MSNTMPPDDWGDPVFERDGFEKDRACERARAEQLLVASAGQGSHGLRFLKTRLLAAARREARLRDEQRKARLVSSTLMLMVGVLFLGAICDRLPEVPPAPVVAAVVREARQPWATKVVPGESHEPFPGDGSEWTLAQTNYDPVERLRERWEELV